MSEETEIASDTSAPEASATETSDVAQESNQEAPQRQAYAPFVDLSDLPEEKRQAIEARFDHFSRLMRKNDRVLNEYRGITSEQSRRIDELSNGFGTVVGHLQERTFSDTETQLTEAMHAAHESGDTRAFIDAQNKLIELKAEKKIAEQQRKAAPAQPNRAPIPSAREITNGAYEDGDLTQSDMSFINSWQDETDDSGMPLRPWARSRSHDPHNPDPMYVAALAETQAVWMHPRFANKSVEEKMAEVDRRMGVARAAPRQSVMGGGLTGAKKTNKITLSPKQADIAIKTKFGGPKAKSDAEHIDAYRKQLEKTNSRKGAR